MDVQLSEHQIEIIIDCINADADRSYMTASMQLIIDTLLAAAENERNKNNASI